MTKEKDTSVEKEKTEEWQRKLKAEKKRSTQEGSSLKKYPLSPRMTQFT